MLGSKGTAEESESLLLQCLAMVRLATDCPLNRGATRTYSVPLKSHDGLGPLPTPAVLIAHDGECTSPRTHDSKSHSAY